MVTEFSTGKTELTMKGSGVLTKLRVREFSGMLKVTFIEVNSKTTWLMGMANTRM